MAIQRGTGDTGGTGSGHNGGTGDTSGSRRYRQRT